MDGVVGKIVVVLLECCVAEGVGRRYDDRETMTVVGEDGDWWLGQGDSGGKKERHESERENIDFIFHFFLVQMTWIGKDFLI